MTVKPDSVTIAYVSAADVRLEFAAALNAAVIRAAGQGIVLRQQPHISGPRIAAARNHQVKTFLQSDTEWLLMIDTDMTFQPDTIERFLAAAHKKDRPIVGGLTWGKGRDGLFPTIYHWNGSGFFRAEGWDADTLVKCDGTGAACLFVHRSVFEKMEEHFSEPNIWFEDGTVPGTTNQMGEDLTFCLRARALGFPIHVDTSNKFGHIKGFEIDQDFYLDWCKGNRLIVTGTGRCGTQYVSKILQMVKVPADHERFFNPYHRELLDWGRADSSWMAAPYLREYRDAFKLHLVRNPMDTINSFVGIGLFDEPCTEPHQPYQDFAREFCPEAFEKDDPVVRAMAFYVLWNEMIEPQADQRLRVDDQITGGNLFPAVKAAGNHHQPWEIDHAIGIAPKNVNSRRRADLTWDDLPDGEWKDRLAAMRKRYGYK